jgi:hypothetical protein
MPEESPRYPCALEWLLVVSSGKQGMLLSDRNKTLVLTAGGIRELHWHDAAEWAVIHLKPKQGERVQGLFRDISCEFEKHEKLAVEMIRHQLRLLMVHLSRLYAIARPCVITAALMCSS